MTDSDRSPDDRADPASAQADAQPRAEGPPSPGSADWQVLLLRYLPQPLGSAHAVKRFSAR